MRDESTVRDEWREGHKQSEEEAEDRCVSDRYAPPFLPAFESTEKKKRARDGRVVSLKGACPCCSQ